jgi:proline-specific peptidase
MSLKEGVNKGESIFDRSIHIEKKVLTEIPWAPRWCDLLKVEKKRIDVGGCEIYVEEEGLGAPLILINGGPGGTHHYFHPWFSRAKEYARVIYYDQRGTGLSDFKPGENGYSVEQAVEDLEAMRKSLKICKWVILGYSYGGFLAQYYTIKYPQNVAGLLLLGSALGMKVTLKETRQYEFISDKERSRIKEVREQIEEMAQENNWSRQKRISLIVYNSLINGDWKRQNMYKPSLQRLCQSALYEWVHDEDFNENISISYENIDLTGAFEYCTIPTLILEGKWDLTWNVDKKEILKNNHPNAKMVIFEKSGHGIYDEEPERFFNTLKSFMLSF